MPCVLLSFEFEHILIWRGRDWKSSLHIIGSNSDDQVTSSSANNSLLVNAEHKSDTCPDAISGIIDEAVTANTPIKSPSESAEAAQSFSGMIFDLDSVVVHT